MSIELRDGIYWPKGDRHCWQVARGEVKDADRAIRHARAHEVCIQAGGNCGLWASYLAGVFKRVWTIEPDFTNYQCLVRNVDGIPGVYPIWAALIGSDGPTQVGLSRDYTNIGAHYVRPGYGVATITIDDLELEACDLIVLDIEGMEPKALDGARETIARFKPVLMVEDKGLSENYGTDAGWTDTFEGYRVIDRVHRDVILVPC